MQRQRQGEDRNYTTPLQQLSDLSITTTNVMDKSHISQLYSLITGTQRDLQESGQLATRSPRNINTSDRMVQASTTTQAIDNPRIPLHDNHSNILAILQELRLWVVNRNNETDSRFSDAFAIALDKAARKKGFKLVSLRLNSASLTFRGLD